MPISTYILFNLEKSPHRCDIGSNLSLFIGGLLTAGLAFATVDENLVRGYRLKGGDLCVKHLL